MTDLPTNLAKSWRRVLVALLLLLAACGGDDVSGEDTPANSTADSATSSTTAPPPATESTEPAAAPSTTTAEAPTTTVEAGPTTTVVSTAEATRQDPIPLGEAQILGSWMLVVSDVEFDGTDTITSFVDFNPEPAEGNQFVIVSLTGTFQGTEHGEPAFEWKLVNDDLEAVPEGIGCGVVPDSVFDLSPIGYGETFTANICIEAPSEAAGDGLQLYLAPFRTQGKYFALD